MEFGFRTGIYTAGGEGPPVYVAAVEVLVDADDEDAAEELATAKVEEMLAPGFITDGDMTPI